ncbi:MAG TPA: hypothetical protein VFQ85_00180 [Mycobacteriales bacterium]|nr:hypothetical protein [Mycobacteriales bacterium]
MSEAPAEVNAGVTDAATDATTDEATAAAAAEVAVVRAARERLTALDGTPVAGHVAVYDEVHDVLQGTLAGLGS